MKVLILSGSPRKSGNTAAVNDVIESEFRLNGAEIKRVDLNSLVFRGCQGCMACKTGKDDCILKDDLAEVLEEVKLADYVVLGSPVYFGDVTSQAKAYIDRTYSFLTPDFYTSDQKSRLSPGKKMIITLQQGAPKENFGDIFDRYKPFFDWQFSDTILIRECGCVAKDVVSRSNRRKEQIKKVIIDLI